MLSGESFPFDGGRGFVGDVVDNAVDAAGLPLGKVPSRNRHRIHGKLSAKRAGPVPIRIGTGP